MVDTLTKAQREWLSDIAKENRAVLDVYSGGARQCIQRLKNKGLIEYVHFDDYRDNYYCITPAGRAALSAANGDKP